MSEHAATTIDSRIHLFSSLTEASEVEHNLMCLYLYAAFSMKRSVSEGVTASQLEAIERWRRVIMQVALEEMTHLTLVSNIIAATGASPNFMRPNFPAAPGLYPADLVIELAPFDLSTIEHFIYLERPESHEVADGASFPHSMRYVRNAPVGRLMPHASDYVTVGSLYRSLREAIETLCDKNGEVNFFTGDVARQIGPLDSPLPGLSLVTDRASAIKAIDTIVIQGEGAQSEEGSHFARFQQIREEYIEILKQDPSFTPGRVVARNPVMRKPTVLEGRVWVREPLAAQYMDLANTLYAFMLRVLVQIYAVENRASSSKRALVESSIDTMHAMAVVGETLTHLTATADQPGIHAGMSFATLRSLAPLESRAETEIMTDRLTQIAHGFDELQSELEREHEEDLAKACNMPESSPKSACIEELKVARDLVERCRKRLLAAPFVAKDGPTKVAPTTNITPTSAAPKVELSKPAPRPVSAKTISEDAADKNAPRGPKPPEVARGKKLTLTFDSTRCIHARHCVTESPRVFKANTPGEWIFPDESDPQVLAAVLRECPSGALTYELHDGAEGEGSPRELTPEVNLIHLRENGPYAVLAEMRLRGKPLGFRATLCRCGASNNKPFCDGSHIAAGFQATGEPATMSADALESRAGSFDIEPTKNGPLAVSGNVEICAGTGRVVLRTVGTRLCRCGHSKNKPLCDGSHGAANFVAD